MSKLRFENPTNEEVGLSQRRGSFTKRFMAMTGSAALVVGGAASVFVGASAASATAAFASYLTSGSYQIGTGSVSGVTVTLNGTTASTPGGATSKGIYTVTFVATNAIALNEPVTVSNLGTPTSPSAGTFTVSGSAAQSVAPAASGTGVTFNAPVAVSAGSSVTVQFQADNGTAAGTYTPTVATATSNPVAAQSSTSITLVAAAGTVNLTDSASPTTAGATATLSLGIPELTQSATGSTLSGLAAQSTLVITLAGGSFTGNVNDYTVTDTTANTSQTPTAAVQSGVGNDTVTLTLGTAIPQGDAISITAKNVTNPTGSATPSITINDGSGTGTQVFANTNPATQTSASTFPAISYGAAATAITGLTASASPTTVSASSSYSFSFKATTAIPTSGATIVVTLPSGSTVATATTGAVVTDVTHPSSASESVVASTSGSAGATNNVATIANTVAIAAGDTVNVTLLGVTNAATSGSQSVSVSTGVDTVPVSASFQLTAATTTTLTPTVTPSSSTTGVLNNYTITNVSAAAAYATGSTTGQIGLYFPTTNGVTSYPTAPSQYMINDLTNPADSGPAATVAVDGSSPTGYSGVLLTVSKAIASGDNLSIVVTGVTNPGTAGLDTMEFGGLNASTQTVATFPSAGMTYPNGALVQSGGQIDVIAGGYAFGIPSLSALAQLGNSSTVVAGTFPTATAPRAGTLIAVAGAPGIWVVGTNGMIYQFSSVSQFLADGYSPMQVVEVPSAGGLTVGTGVPPTAAATMADGSVQNFGGTLYVFDGGVAFGIPNIATANTILAATGSTPIVGSGSAPMAGTVANGAILQVGSSTYVTSGGMAYLSTGSSQLASSGYSTMYAVQVPSLGSITVA